MSAENVARVFHYSKARGVPRLTLLTIAFIVPVDGGFTTVEEILHAARLDRRSVQRTIRLLEESGELRVQTVGVGPGRKRHYRVTCNPSTTGGE